MVTAIEPQVAPTGRYSVGETCKHPDVIKKLHICYPNPRGRKEIEPRGNSWL